jgi:hypothetical protein
VGGPAFNWEVQLKRRLLNGAPTPLVANFMPLFLAGGLALVLLAFSPPFEFAFPLVFFFPATLDTWTLQNRLGTPQLASNRECSKGPWCPHGDMI